MNEGISEKQKFDNLIKKYNGIITSQYLNHDLMSNSPDHVNIICKNPCFAWMSIS